MATQQRSTVVGVFHDHKEADRAVNDLLQAGFRNDQIGVAGRHAESTTHAAVAGSDEGSHAGTGAVTGALAGAGLGGLVGLGILAGIIPAIGPVIAGGTLAALLANAAGGAAIGTLAGSLMGAGVPEDEAKYYHNEFEQGRIIVTVKADGRGDEATAILRRHGAYDMQSSGTSVAGSTGTRTATATTTATGSHAGAATTSTSHAGTASGANVGSASRATGDRTIEVREEQLEATKRPVEAGEVRVRKEVTTEHKNIEVPVRHEEVVIERHTATGKHASSGDIREGEEIRIPVMDEEVDVRKKAVVKEEVTVGKRVVEGTERVGGDVREEHVRVEREGDVDIRGTGNERKKPGS